jgi:hypothetical protein
MHIFKKTKTKTKTKHNKTHVVLTFKDDIFRSDFLRSFMQFQHHNITSDKWSDQNNERFYHVKHTVENRRPSKMGDFATLLFVHFSWYVHLIPHSGPTKSGNEKHSTSFFPEYRTYVSLYYNAYL